MADRKEFDIDGKPLSSLRVVDLKQELEKRGMSKSGSKKELSDRLKMQLQLEKLHESASTDEGHVPNLGLQDDEIAEHSDLIKDYLAKQQQIYEIQKEAIRRVELEDQRIRESSEASAGDTSQEEEEIESKVEDEPCAEDLSFSKSKKKDNEKKQRKLKEDKEEKFAEKQRVESSNAGFSMENEILTKVTSEPEQDSKSPINKSKAVLEKEENTSAEISMIPPNVDTDEISSAIAQIEPAFKGAPDAVLQENTNKDNIPERSSVKESPLEIDENAAAVDSITFKMHVAPEELIALPDSGIEISADKMPEKIHKSDQDLDDTSKHLESDNAPSIVESPVGQSETLDLLKVQITVEAAKETVESLATKKENSSSNVPQSKHKIKLRRPILYSSSSSVRLKEIEPESAQNAQNQGGISEIGSGSPIDTPTAKPEEICEGVGRTVSPTKEEESNDVPIQSHQLSSEAEETVKDDVTGDSLKEKNEGKKEEETPKDADKPSSIRTSLRSESPPRIRRRQPSSSSESTSDESSSSSRSRLRYRSGSSSDRSKSRSPSTSRDAIKQKEVVSHSEESMEPNEDLVSRHFPKQSITMDTEGDGKTADVDDSSSAADTLQVLEMPKDSKDVVVKLPEKEFPSRITSRKISLSSKTKKGDTDGKENGAADEEKPQRKRKWGGSSTVTAAVGKKLSLSISTDSLKGLIPDVKPLTTINSGPIETVPEMPVEKTVAKQSESVSVAKEDRPTTPVSTPTSAPATKRDIIIYRTVTQVVKDSPQTKFLERETAKGKLVKNSAPISYNDDAGAARRSPSPSRCPPSCIIHIRNLVRPFTDILLKELLSRTGTLVQGGFWMDKIKSKCYATFESEDQAVATRYALHGVQWPYSNPKRLSVDFATQDELEFHRGLIDNPDLKVVPFGRNIEVPLRVPKSPPAARRKEITMTEPAPAGRQRKDSHKSERDKDKERKELKQGSHRSQPDSKLERGPGGRDRETEKGRGRERERDAAGSQLQPPIREWDRDKIGEKSPGERARAARNRGRSLSSRSRSRSRLVKSPQPDGFSRGRNREAEMRDRRDRKDIRRKDEEAPAKLLDDLFHKTKTTPCIYWLPLTGDQAKMREEERKQRQMEREKRRQMEQTDRTTGGTHSEPNRRTRENDKENSRVRKRSESPARSRTRRR